MALIVLILLIAALVFTLWHAANGKVALWLPVLLIAIALLLERLPVR